MYIEIDKITITNNVFLRFLLLHFSFLLLLLLLLPRNIYLPLILVTSRIILRSNHQPPPLPRPPKNRFHKINHLLFVLHCPINFIIIPRPQIDHHVFISIKKHDGTRVVEFVHFVEIGDFGDVDEVDYGKVFYFFGDGVECFVHFHAGRVLCKIIRRWISFELLLMVRSG